MLTKQDLYQVLGELEACKGSLYWLYRQTEVDFSLESSLRDLLKNEFNGYNWLGWLMAYMYPDLADTGATSRGWLEELGKEQFLKDLESFCTRRLSLEP